MRTQIFNLIILDESGSMGCVHKATIDGCNETLNTIRASQKKFRRTQEHFVSIFAFQGDGDRPSRYLIENLPIVAVKDITKEDYKPYGNTPLYDAVGATLTDLKKRVSKSPVGLGSVTIITDGMENSSRRYTLPQVVKKIEALKELGWNFNFIGANIDVTGVAIQLKIDNAYQFEQDEEGTRRMFGKMGRSRMNYNSRINTVMENCPAPMAAVSDKGRAEIFKSASEGYFEEDNEQLEAQRVEKLKKMAKQAARKTSTPRRKKQVQDK